MSKKGMNYKSFDSLENVKKVINASSEALKDANKTMLNTPIPELVGGIGGGIAGGIIAGGLIYGLGQTGLAATGITSGLKALGFGISMLTGVGVAAAIVAVPAVGGYALFTHAKNKRLKEEKERLYQEALRKHDALIATLKKESNASHERAEYLNRLVILLSEAIKTLKEDLDGGATAGV